MVIRSGGKPVPSRFYDMESEQTRDYEGYVYYDVIWHHFRSGGFQP